MNPQAVERLGLRPGQDLKIVGATNPKSDPQEVRPRPDRVRDPVGPVGGRSAAFASDSHRRRQRRPVPVERRSVKIRPRPQTLLQIRQHGGQFANRPFAADSPVELGSSPRCCWSI